MNEWKKKLNIEKSNEKKYILCYLFQGLSKKVEKNIKIYAKQNGLDIKYIPMTSDEIKHNLKNGFDVAIGPKEFVELFYNAQFIITNSFHGLLFSLIMNKPFYLLHRGEGSEWAKHEERMTNILRLVHLENRFLFEKEVGTDLDFKIDYKFVNAIISSLRKESLKYLEEALYSVKKDEKITNKKTYKRIDELSRSKCTGCTLCVNVCPRKAIHMIESEEGFYYPIINEAICVNCGACAKKCPVIIPFESVYPIETFCGAGNSELVKKSASGGAFVTFSNYVIEYLKGVVFGAALIMPAGVCKHISVDSVNSLYRLQNSKYVQSDISSALPECKSYLQKGRVVLFSGTPCQIAALKKYLGEEYTNLITIDIVCHGVPSPKFLKEYIKNEIPNDVTELFFRHRFEAEKKRSAFDINYFHNGKMIIKPGSTDLFYAPFINAESYRECCYHCQYARENRVSDITIGDCDSYSLYQGIEPNNILSSIIINTENGIRLWEKSKAGFSYMKMNYQEECFVNHQLRRPSKRPDRRNVIYKELQEGWEVYKKKNEKKYGIEFKIKRVILKFLR